MPETNSQPALLLVGHGTRSARGTASARKLAEIVAQRLAPARVELAFLEIQEPSVGEGLARLVEQGAGGIVVLPILLFAAGHALRDIPEAISVCQATNLAVVQADHLGCHEAIVELSRRRFTEALQSRSEIPSEQTVPLLVGRGSREESATAEMHAFAALRGAGVQVAFLAMAQPSLADALRQIAATAPRRVIVQPHLLFHGDLVESLHAQVQQIAQSHPQTEWIVTPLLANDLGEGGPADDFLVRAVLDRYHAAAIRVVAAGGGG